MATDPARINSHAHARGVAAGLGVSLSCLQEGLGCGDQALEDDPAAFQLALRPVSRTLEILTSLFRSREAIRLWLRTPHPDLDGRTALETILAGQGQAVCMILENALAGVPV